MNDPTIQVRATGSGKILGVIVVNKRPDMIQIVFGEGAHSVRCDLVPTPDGSAYVGSAMGREIVYARRREILGSSNLKTDVLAMAENVASGIVSQFATRETHASEWDWKALSDTLYKSFNLRFAVADTEKDDLTVEHLEQMVIDQILASYDEKERTFTPPVLRHLEKLVLLQTLDTLWKDHLLSMDHLKEGIGLRGYAQQNPLQEYKKEGFEIFEGMMQQRDADVVEKVFTVQIARQQDVERMQQQRRPQPIQMVMSGGGTPQRQAGKVETVRRDGDKVGRNDPCPCGSGKKYKKCHGTT